MSQSNVVQFPECHRHRPVVQSPATRQVDQWARKFAATELSILVLGETGVGKEVLAQQIHDYSPRASAPLLRLNCVALSETLVESELFGHERGAFTGADKARIGLFESAHGGTVFLDEIGELSAGMQVKLLRVLEEKRILPVGAVRPRAVDIRFIAATHRNLEDEVALGRFRADLYFRLNGVTLTLPPLRERPEEIIPLAEFFLAQLRSGPPPTLSANAVRWLLAHRWPGNVRELRNLVERAAVYADYGTITAEHLGPVSREPTPSLSLPPANVHQVKADAERDHILDVLQKCGGNQSKAAELLEISRRTLIKRLDKYQVVRPRKQK